MDSHTLARYMEATGSEFKPWLLIQLRLKKLHETKDQMPHDDYLRQLNDVHQDLMALGEWWVGQEDDVFGDADSKS